MHDVGRLVLYLSDHVGFAAHDREDEVREHEIFGVMHGQVGACLAEHWGLEDDIVWAILSHHRASGDSKLAQRIALADRIAYWIGYGGTRDAETAESIESDPQVAGFDEVAERVLRSFDIERTLFA